MSKHADWGIGYKAVERLRNYLRIKSNIYKDNMASITYYI